MKKITEEELDNILATASLVRVGTYTTSKEPLEVKCLECGKFRQTNTARLLYAIRQGKTPCPRCSRREPVTNEIIDDKLKGLGIKRLSTWSGDLHKMWWQCLQCSHTWATRATKIINQGTKCPRCSYTDRNRSSRLTNDQIDDRLKERPIERNQHYPGSVDSKMSWLCTVCSNQWLASANKILNQYTGCPACSGGKYGRYGHKAIYNDMVFDSHLERDCYFILLKHFVNGQILRQQPYPHNKRMTCDFVVPTSCNNQLWIEVSNIKTKHYLQRIETKRRVIHEQNNLFMFYDNPKKLDHALNEISESAI